MNFATWLRKSREQIGLSRPDLAKRLGVHPNTITNYEGNIQTPDDEKLERIADVFKTRFIDLWVACNDKTHKRVVELLEKGRNEESWSDSDDLELKELCELLKDHPRVKSAVLLMAKSLLKEGL